MCQKGVCVIDFIDDYVRMVVSDIGHASFNTLFQLKGDLELAISDQKLVSPSTKVVCLGILINTENGTVSIPPGKSMTLCVSGSKKQCVPSNNCNPYLACCCMFINVWNQHMPFWTECWLCWDMAMLLKNLLGPLILNVILGGLPSYSYFTMGVLFMITGPLIALWNWMPV